jgi:hypothetical protein
MNDAKYIGLDVHQATISATVLDSTGKLVMESILETKAETILQFILGLRGSLHVTFEEGTCAAWLHDLLKPHVTQVLVCDPRKNALLKVGNKSDRAYRKLSSYLLVNRVSNGATTAAACSSKGTAMLRPYKGKEDDRRARASLRFCARVFMTVGTMATFMPRAEIAAACDLSAGSMTKVPLKSA